MVRQSTYEMRPPCRVTRYTFTRNEGTARIPLRNFMMDKVVEKALDDAFGGSMRAKSIANRADLARAIDTFTLLKEKGCTFTADTVCAYVSSKFEWQSDAQNELKKLVRDICNGVKKQRPKGYSPSWKEGTFDRWQTSANSETQPE